MELKNKSFARKALKDDELEAVSGGFSVPWNAYQIDMGKCINCFTCVSCCPVDAIRTQGNSVCGIDQGKCKVCGSCAENCPVRAISQ